MTVEMNKFEIIKSEIKTNPKVWLLTGVAGFIGSNILETLLKSGQKVVGLDNFETGFKKNLDEVQSELGPDQWKNFYFVEGNICDFQTCENLFKTKFGKINYVLHQAALGSVPRSIDNPLNTNSANITGFMNILTSSKNANVESFTYAGSSSTYGDNPDLPKKEETIGNPLSPYAVTKYVNELYASVFSRTYGFDCIGLRYFNVFGKRQNPNGDYAPVIPKWIAALLSGNEVYINGDGETSRDFCFIENVIQANILAALAGKDAKNKVFNIALGDRTTLNELYAAIKNTLKKNKINIQDKLIYKEFRKGDVRHTQADISMAKKYLGYDPNHKILEGLDIAMPWYIKSLSDIK